MNPRKSCLLFITLFLVFSSQVAADDPVVWDLSYEADELPMDPTWRKVGNQYAEVTDGKLYLEDNSSTNYIEFRHTWAADNSVGTTMEVRVQNISGNNQAVYFRFYDGTWLDLLYIEEDRIQLNNAGLFYYMDTQDDFHTYRITVRNRDVAVYVDGMLRICGVNALVTPTTGQSFIFGDNSASGTGIESLWDYVRFTTHGVFPPDGSHPICAGSPDGFEPPLSAGPVTVRKNRALPLRTQLIDLDGYPVTDLEISASPVVQVIFDSQNGDPPTDVSDDALPLGHSDEGNQFIFIGSHWQYNLSTKKFDAPGTYTIYVVSGDDSEYLLSPTCEAQFVVR